MQGQILRNPPLPSKPLTRFLYILNPGDKKKEYTARKLIGFSEDEMYSVVADVRHYKQFLPFCTKSKILSSKPDLLIANLEIGFPPIVENYTSRVALDRPRSVRAVCSDGKLFEYLETTWRFGPGLRSNPRSCITDFYIRFEFKSALYSNLAALFFDRLVEQMEGAFVGEAARRFGEPSTPIHKLSPMPLKR